MGSIPVLDPASKTAAKAAASVNSRQSVRSAVTRAGARLSGRIATRIATGAFLGIGASAALLAATAGTADAKPRKIDPSLFRAPLLLTSFVQDGRTDVARNEVLEFKFSSLVRGSSVDARTIRILEQSGAGARQATGALITRANVVRFDPTRSQRNYDESRKPDSTVIEGDNPSGFDAYTDYVIEIPGPPDLHVLKNARGDRIRHRADGGCRTNASYFDPVPGQPYFVGSGMTGNLGFDPPRSGATGLVDEDALILLEFSEPIDIDTLDPSSTITVTRIRVNEQVPGFVRLDPSDRSGKRFQFVPSLGFGSDVANLSGWDIEVKLTEGIKDLAGNPLKRPYTAPLFRTRYVEGKKSASIVSETFANQTRMDPVTVTDGGEWNTIEKGALRGGAATTYPNQDVNYGINGPGITVVRTRANEPLVTDTAQAGCVAARPLGARAQMLYIPADVGEPAAIVAAGWGPSSNALFGASHPEITLEMGHTSNSAVVADYSSNINVGNAVQVYRGPYLIQQKKNVNPADPVDASGVSNDPNATGFWLWPAFTTPFEWNGVNNLVFDAACQPATTCQIQRISFIPAGIPFPNRRSVGTSYTATSGDFTVDTVVYDARFQKRRRTTRATSLWYELASDTPEFANAIVSPSGQPGGVTALVEVEGAHGKPDPLRPGGFIPNTTTASGWQTVISQIDGHRFFRFRVTMIANLATNQSVRVTSIQVPYQF